MWNNSYIYAVPQPQPGPVDNDNENQASGTIMFATPVTSFTVTENSPRLDFVRLQVSGGCLCGPQCLESPPVVIEDCTVLPLPDPDMLGSPAVTSSCGIVSTTFTDSAATTVACGSQEVVRTFTYTDPAGQETNCLQIIRFKADTGDPVIQCGDDVDLGCLSSEALLSTLIQPPVVTNLCQDGTLTVTATITRTECGGEVIQTTMASNPCSDTVVMCMQTFIYTLDIDPSVTNLPPGGYLGCQAAGFVPPIPATEYTVQDAFVTNDISCEVTVTRTFTETGCCGQVDSADVIYTYTKVPNLVVGPLGKLDVGCIASTNQIPPVDLTMLAATSDCAIVSIQKVGQTDPVPPSAGDCVWSNERVFVIETICDVTQTVTQAVCWIIDSPAEITGVSQGSNWLCQAADFNPDPDTVTFTNATNTAPELTETRTTNGCEVTVTREYRVEDCCGSFDRREVVHTFNVAPADVVFECTGLASLDLGCVYNPQALPPGDPSLLMLPPDICEPNVTVTDSPPRAVSSCGFEFDRVYLATDVCGNVYSCTQLVSYITDLEPPKITCPPGGSLGCIPDGVDPVDYVAVVAPVPAAVTNVVVVDNCTNCMPEVCLWCDTYSTNGCVVTLERKFSATDCCGNVGLCSIIFTMNDTQPAITNLPAGGYLGCQPCGYVPPTNLADFAASCPYMPELTNQPPATLCQGPLTWAQLGGVDPDANGDSVFVNDYTTATPTGTVLSHGNVQCATGSPVDFVVRFEGAANQLAGTGNNNLPTKSFTINAAGEAAWFSRIDQLVAGSFSEISLEFYDLGTYNPVTDSGTPTDFALSIVSIGFQPIRKDNGNPASETIGRLHRVEEHHIRYGSSCLDSVITESDPFDQLFENVTPLPGFDYAMKWAKLDAAGNPVFGNDLNGDGILNVSEADFSVNLPPRTEFHIRRDFLNTIIEGDKSGIGFGGAVGAPIPSFTIPTNCGFAVTDAFATNDVTCQVSVTRTYSVTGCCGQVVSEDVVYTYTKLPDLTVGPLAKLDLGCIASTNQIPPVDLTMLVATSDCAIVSIQKLSQTMPVPPAAGDCVWSNERVFVIETLCDVTQTVTQAVCWVLNNTLPEITSVSKGSNWLCQAGNFDPPPDIVTYINATNTAAILTQSNMTNGCEVMVMREYRVEDCCGNFDRRQVVHTYTMQPGPLTVDALAKIDLGCVSSPGAIPSPSAMLVNASSDCSVVSINWLGDTNRGTMLVGPGFNNGDFNDEVPATGTLNFNNVASWYEFGGNNGQTASTDGAARSGRAGTLSTAGDRVHALDTCYTPVAGETIDLCFWWRDNFAWVDGQDEVEVQFYLGGTLVSTYVAPVSTMNATYEQACTSFVAPGGGPLTITFNGLNNSGGATGFARIDDVVLTASGGGAGTGCCPPQLVERVYEATDVCGDGLVITQQICYVLDTNTPRITAVAPFEDFECQGDVRTLLMSSNAVESTGAISTQLVMQTVITNGCQVSVTRTWRVEDCCGNFDIKTEAYRYTEPAAPPMFTDCPVGPLVVGCIASSNQVPYVLLSATGCQVTVTSVDGPHTAVPGTCGDWTFERVFTATDACGTTEECSFDIAYTLDIPPVTPVPEAPFTANCVAAGMMPAGFPDAQPGLLVSTNLTDNGCEVELTRTYTTTNCCGDIRTASVTHSWTIQQAPPTITGQAAVNLGCISNAGLIPVPSSSQFTTTAGCGPVAVALFQTSSTNMTSICDSELTRTYRVTDECGQTADFVQTITYTLDLVPEILAVEKGTNAGCVADGFYPATNLAAIVVTNMAGFQATPVGESCAMDFAGITSNTLVLPLAATPLDPEFAWLADDWPGTGGWPVQLVGDDPASPNFTPQGGVSTGVVAAAATGFVGSATAFCLDGVDDELTRATFSGDGTPNPAFNPVTFEICLSPSNLTQQAHVFETGGAGAGLSLVVSNNFLILHVRDNAPGTSVAIDLTPFWAAPGDWFCAAFSVNQNTDEISMAVSAPDGTSKSVCAPASINNAFGGNNTSLGQVNGNTAYGADFGGTPWNTAFFTGKIASFRVYNGYQRGIDANDVTCDRRQRRHLRLQCPRRLRRHRPRRELRGLRCADQRHLHRHRHRALPGLPRVDQPRPRFPRQRRFDHGHRDRRHHHGRPRACQLQPCSQRHDRGHPHGAVRTCRRHRCLLLALAALLERPRRLRHQHHAGGHHRHGHDQRLRRHGHAHLPHRELLRLL